MHPPAKSMCLEVDGQRQVLALRQRTLPGCQRLGLRQSKGTLQCLPIQAGPQTLPMPQTDMPYHNASARPQNPRPAKPSFCNHVIAWFACNMTWGLKWLGVLGLRLQQPATNDSGSNYTLQRKKQCNSSRTTLVKAKQSDAKWRALPVVACIPVGECRRRRRHTAKTSFLDGLPTSYSTQVL